MNKKVNLNKINKKEIIIFSSLILFMIICIAIFINTRDYSKVNLRVNNRKIFTVSDLKVNNLEYGDSYQKTKKYFGKPTKEEKKIINNYNYRILKYKGLTLTFKENYDEFILTKVKITSKKYKVSNIRVGNNVKKVLKSYKISNKDSAYMYGNYSESSLNDASVIDNIYYGKREKDNITYINRDAIIYSDNTKLPVNIAKLIFNYKNNHIKSIEWSYDLQESE